VALVLITGSTGLIGRHTMAAWPRSLGVSVVVHARHDLLAPGVFGDLIRDVAPDVVLHLAWSASSTPGYRSSPANEAWHVASLEAARTCLTLGSRFVGVGSVVDDQPDGDAYTASKYTLRTDLRAAIDAGDVTWLRPHYVFDPDEPSPAVLRDAVAARAAGRPVVLTTPAATHDFVHAADVGRAVVASVVHRLTGLVDIGSGRLRTVQALVEACGATWTTSAQPPGPAQEGRRADVAALRATGWLPTETEGYFAHG
jgi:nucleoside-diphosphate-sugar epimerase